MSLSNIQNSFIEIINSFFIQNFVLFYGTIYLFNAGNISISNCIFKENQAQKGAAIYYDEYLHCYTILFIILLYNYF